MSLGARPFDPLRHPGPEGSLDGLPDPGEVTILPTGPDDPAAVSPIQPRTAPYATDATAAGGATATTAATSAGSTTVVTSASSSLVINISWDASVSGAPAAFTTAVTAAAQYLESHFTDAVTVNISIGYGEVHGTALGGGTLGSSESSLTSVRYSTLRNAVSSDATSTLDTSAANSLPSSSPVSGTFWTTTANAKSLGLLSATATATATDGYVGFSSSAQFTYDNSGGVAAGTYDFNAVALHEMTEVMGRILLTGTTVGTKPNGYNLMDLFHWSSAGVRDFSAGTPGYLSADGGATSLGTFNTVSGGDAGDWASSMGNDAFDAFATSGVVNPVTANDLGAMDIIGWDLAATACFLRGTRIATPGGERPVERLAIGDPVLTASGRARPVRWIGRRRYTAGEVARSPQLRPVVIRAGALAPCVPRRDLLLSPRHALFLAGRLVPAAALVNGASIARRETAAVTEYFHIELEDQDILRAEGAAVESFADDNSRWMFDNCGSFHALYGETTGGRPLAAPRLEEGHELEALRRRLAARAGLVRPAPRTGGPLRGHVERITDGRIEGWATDALNQAGIELELIVDGVTLARRPANRYRADLDAAGLAGGRCGFSIPLFRAPRLRHGLAVRRALDGASLAMAPGAMQPPPKADADLAESSDRLNLLVQTKT